jgi:hypothetical protein
MLPAFLFNDGKSHKLFLLHQNISIDVHIVNNLLHPHTRQAMKDQIFYIKYFHRRAHTLFVRFVQQKQKQKQIVRITEITMMRIRFAVVARRRVK